MLQIFAWIGKDVIHLHLTGIIPYYQTSSLPCLQFLKEIRYAMPIVQLTVWRGSPFLTSHLFQHSASDSEVKTGHLNLHQHNQSEQQTEGAESPGRAGRLWHNYGNRRWLPQSWKHEMTPTTGMLRWIAVNSSEGLGRKKRQFLTIHSVLP